MPRRGTGRGGRRAGQRDRVDRVDRVDRGGGASTEAAFQIDDKDENDVLVFVDITQAPPDVAKHFLEAYGGNMEAAVTGFLEGGGRDDVQQRTNIDPSGERETRTHSSRAVGRAVDAVDHDDKDSDYDEGEDRDDEDELSDDSLDQLQTLASHRSLRERSNRGSGQNRKDDDDGDEEDDGDDGDDGDDVEDYVSEDAYGEEEERFKYGRRTRRGHRRSMRQMQRQQSREDEDAAAQHIPGAVLSLPDVNLEEQKMLMAAMTGQAYTGEIPDFSNFQSYSSKPLSPGAIERQILREEQDLAFQESLEMDRERQHREDQARIEQMEREESARRKEWLLSEQLEDKKRRLPAEPASDDPMGLLLAIRLPDGTRLKRRFSKTDALRSVFDYVDVECGPGLANVAYRLVTNFPRKVFERTAEQQASMGLGELGFSKQEALFVETTAV